MSFGCSGLIGRSYAMLFAAAGYQVRLFDIEPKQVQNALKEIESQHNELEKTKLLRGSRTAKQQMALISGNARLAAIAARNQWEWEGSIHRPGRA